MSNKYEALDRLHEIMQELDELGQQAAHIFQNNFPDLYQTGDAYGAFSLGSSWNSYDTTLAKLVEWAENRDYVEDEEDEEEYA